MRIGDRRGSSLGVWASWGFIVCASVAVGCAASEPNGSTGSAGTGSPGQAGTTGQGGSTGQAGTSGQAGTPGSGGAGATGVAGSGGSPGSGGAGATGQPGSGGSNGGGGASGQAGSGGATGGVGEGGRGSGGSTGGSAVGGRGGSGGRAGSGGSAGNGSGGSSGATGTGGTGPSTMPAPSAGCGKSGRPSGGKVEVSGQSLHYFPTTYDGTKPFPLLIALHACGNPNTEFVSLTNGNGLDTTYVRTFPNTPDSGQCWSNYSGDVARILQQYDDLMANYCIDKNRVFATAHSSGAQMLVNILSHKTDAQHLNLRGVAPVAADPYNVAVPMPVMYIDGKMDNQRSADSAKNTVAKFRAANMCSDTSKPYTAVMMCTSTDGSHPVVDPGCIIYDNCTVPTIWCSHNDPSYSGTQHGVPCFAMKAMAEFFAGL